MACDVAGRLLDREQVRLPGLPRWRPDADEDDLRVANRVAGRADEPQPAGGDVATEEVVQPRLLEGHTADLERLELGLVLIGAGDLMAEFGQRDARHEADVTCPDDGDPHQTASRRFGMRPAPASSDSIQV